ncbi:MAG: Co2+/Mg2+ efflux protein ApaG [Pseudomonadota bacterium]
MKPEIVIEPESYYMESESLPDNGRFAFAYTIKITNKGTLSAQLISRYWRILDVENGIKEVKGEGVVGQKPVLEPGETFEYTSSSVISAPVGTMEGHYHFISEDGEAFDVVIPRFVLSIPRVIH